MGKLNETDLGNEIESLVINEEIGNIIRKIELIKRAIAFRIYISCKFANGAIHTIIKPANITENKIKGYCYLKNKEIEYEISDITDLILRESPFIFRLNGDIGVSEIKSFILKYTGSLSPIRIKYTRGTWGELFTDIDTGEVILNAIENTQSLRTITGFDLVSKIIPQEEISRFKLDDINYISGYCHLKSALRVFKFDRINELEILNI